MDVVDLWATYADHVARLFGGAPSLVAARGSSWFAVLTCEQHTDVNQCVLLPGATSADADDLVAMITDADIPAVVSVTSQADADVTAPLAVAGLNPVQLPEPLMWCHTRPARDVSPFDVTRVIGKAALQQAIAVCAEGHAIDVAILNRLLGRDPSGTEDVSTWIAWDADTPVSVVWLTHGDRIGVWEMMTPPAHRRRGAGRAVLGAALSESWQSTTDGAFLWATPLGRPLYESFGFHAIDEPTVWVTAGGEAANLAIGQPG